MSQYRLLIQVALDVLGQGTGGSVTLLGGAGRGLQHDVVEIAAQLAPPYRQRCRGSFTLEGEIGRAGLKPRRWRSGIAARSPSPGQQFVEQDTQRVNVGGGGDRCLG